MDEETANNCINIAKSEIASNNYSRALEFLERAQRLHSPYASQGSEASKLVKLCNAKLKEPASSAPKQQQSSDTFEGARKTTFGSNSGNSSSSQPQQQQRRATTSSSSSTASPTSPSGSSTTSEPASPSASSSEPKEGVDYTKEDADACKIILSKKDYYEILSVTKTATSDEIKKSYKKLAVKFHPDRNRAPQASEAFKSVSAAYMCLSDEQKRKMYDTYGTEDLASRASAGGNHYFQHYGGEHMTEEDVFDIFAQMFGGEFARRQYRGRGGQQRRQQPHQHFRFHFGGDEDEDDGTRTRQGRRRQQQPQGFNLGVLFQLLPLLLIVLFSVFAQFSTFGGNQEAEEVFSFVKTAHYDHSRRCQFGDIKYYVKKDFERSYAHNPYVMRQVDQRVYQKYKTHLSEECRIEQKRRDHLARQANIETDPGKKQVYQEKYQSFKMEKCEMFRTLYGY